MDDDNSRELAATAELDTPARPTSVRWTMFALSCGTSWFLYLHRYTWNFVGPQLQTEYGFNDTQIGTLGSLFNWTYGLGQIPSGLLSDFLGPHLLLGTMIVAWSLVLPCFGFSGRFIDVAAIRLAFGATQATAYPALARVTHSWFPISSRTAVQGWVATFFGRSGGAMSSILLGYVLMGACGLSWRVSLSIMGLAGLMFGLAFLWLFRNSPEKHSGTNEAECALIREGEAPASADAPRVLPWRRVLKNRSMRFFVIQQITSAGADIVFSLFMGGYFLFAKKIDIAEAGLLVSLPLFGGAIGGMLGGYCNDWLISLTGNRRLARTIVGFTGKSLACVLMFVAISQDSARAAGIALFVVKFFSDWSQPTVWGTCTDLGGRYSATVFSIINTSGTIGGVICPPLFGWILDLNSERETVDGVTTILSADYTPMFTVVAIMYIISACCWLFIDCTDSLDRGEPSDGPEPPER